MIRPQRRVHRAVFLVLAVLIPVVWVSAWRARQAPATMDAIPAVLRTPIPINSEGKR